MVSLLLKIELEGTVRMPPRDGGRKKWSEGDMPYFLLKKLLIMSAKYMLAIAEMLTLVCISSPFSLSLMNSTTSAGSLCGLGMDVR